MMAGGRIGPRQLALVAVPLPHRGEAMDALKTFVRNYAKAALILFLTAAAYSFARLPTLPDAERRLLASHFSFIKQPLPGVPGYAQKSIRAVHPSLDNISAWISSVGASVALSYLDEDGLPNDLVYVDPRIDQVIVAPVPGTPARYRPFVLNPAPLPFDPDTMAPMGCLPGDFNEDGLTDILVYYWGRTPVLFLRKNEPAAELAESEFARCELVPDGGRWYTNCATQADLDGDGHIDLIIGNYFPDNARILDAGADGREQMQHSMSRASNGGRNRLCLWGGATSGEKPTAQFYDNEHVLSDEIACGWTLAVGAADLDGDLLPELYFANDFGPDHLLRNLSRPGNLRFEPLIGEKKFATPGSKVLGRDSFKGMGVDFADLNGDGLLDIYVSNIAAEYALEESHFLWLSTGQTGLIEKGVAPYEDHSEQLGLARSGWGWDTRFGDFNNDGVPEALQATGFLKGTTNRWPELHELAMGNDQLLQDPRCWPRFRPGDSLTTRTHNPFFVRASDGRYYDLASEVGFDTDQVTRGIATADVDGDGRLDIAIANQWDTSYFYRNVNPDNGAFLGLRLLLPLGGERPETVIFNTDQLPSIPRGRPAVGACATVHLPDGRKLVSQVDGGNGHSGKRAPDLHFGLGSLAPDSQLRVDLRWKDSTGQQCHKSLTISPGWHTLLLGR